VEPETLTDLEIGIGYRRGSFRGYANLFYMNFEDEIIKKGGLDRFGQPRTGNADRTTHQGIELIGEMQLTPRLALNGNFMYSRNILETYSIFEGGEEVKLDGNVIAGFPDVLANLRLTYSWRNLYLSAIGKYVGRQYTDNFENKTNSVDPFTVVNVNLRYGLRQIGLDGFVLQARINNLLDRKYLMYGNGEEFFPAATRNAFVTLRYEFQ
jgi:iron complex outermembrane receptor protein